MAVFIVDHFGREGTYVDIDIHFNRPVTFEDLTLDVFITALSGLFEFKGHDPEAALAGAVQALNESPTKSTQQFDKPTVSTVNARIDPATVKRGGTVLLMLEFEIGGPAGNTAEVVETRNLLFKNRPLPGYPITKEISREPGQYETSLPQRIPDSAPIGVYEFRGEVCVDGECVSRRRTVEVLP